ncbi:B-cell CLL/lymphoma 6 member B protein-like [Carassius carassius]|uniref:B-cell CLL/lymphoma 6 member B protein-like n=1 Tax=Carassius carassius TaxID=217509 RepID=UPI0028690A3C|nr:B-cell CLL/lymphoma 6 member B protein-like [Carassius carassius]
MQMEEVYRYSEHASAADVMEVKGYIKEFTRHSNDVLLNLNELRHQDILTDATLLVGTARMRAHCAVLIACSGFFYTLFSRRAIGAGGERGFSLTLPVGLDAGSVSLLLDFMYTSCLPLTPQTVSGVLAAASYLQMEHVADTCRAFIHSERISVSPSMMEPASRAPLGGRSPPAHPTIFSSPSRPTAEAEDPTPDRARVPSESFASPDLETCLIAIPKSQTLKLEESSPATPSTPSADSPSHSSGHPNSPAESSGCSLSPQLKKRSESKPSPDPKACNWKKYKYIVLNPLCATPIKEEGPGEERQEQSHTPFVSDKTEASSKTTNNIWTGENPGLNNRNTWPLPYSTSEQNIYFSPLHVMDSTLPISENKGLCSPYVCAQIANQSHLLGQHPIKFEKLSAQLSNPGNQATKTKPSCSGDKPYCCNVCGAQFNRPANLKTHSRIHSGEKPYRCDTCGARFIQVAHLRAHVLIHTGEKPYPCNTCGTRFRHLQTLKSHLRIHTGEKPYSCEKCHLHFRHKSQLRLHLRQKHGAITNTKIRYKVLVDPYQPGPTLLQAC